MSSYLFLKMESTQPTPEESQESKSVLISQRYLLYAMSAFAVFTSYCLRMSLSIAIHEISEDDMEKRYDDNPCPGIKAPPMSFQNDSRNVYSWSKSTRELMASSFYWGYFLSHLPAGFLADQFGGKHVVSASIVGGACISLVIPTTIVFTNGRYQTVFLLRVLEGIFHGAVHPSICAILAQWTLKKDRAAVMSFVYASAPMGIATNTLVGKEIMELTHTWTTPFYLFGALGILMFLLWHFLCYSSPESHPWITTQEKEFLRNGLDYDLVHTWKKVPWGEMFRSGPLWGLLLAELGHDWGWYTMVEHLRNYIKEMLRFDSRHYTIWTSLPFFFTWVMALTVGCFSDWLVYDRLMDITLARKIFMTISQLGPALCLLFASFAECERLKSVVWFVAAMSAMGFYYSSTKTNCLDLAPNYAGIVTGIINGFAVFMGMLSPIMVGSFVTRNTMAEWQNIFWLTFFVFLVTTLMFLVFGSGEKQPWNKLKKIQIPIL